MFPIKSPTNIKDHRQEVTPKKNARPAMVLLKKKYKVRRGRY